MGVFSCMSFTLVTSIMCGFSCISFTLVISIICGFRYISVTLIISLGVLGCISFGYQPVRLSLYQRRFRVISLSGLKLVSFTFGYTVVWLPLYQHHCRLSVCVASSASACGSHPVWLQLYQLYFQCQPMWLQLYQVHFRYLPL